ncbi:sugar kinase [Parapedobacter sp. ISTM3]|uniref:2-dehydro-3-deoxygluconokinase n=1 Tax=Parapedobacter luteus TaxID=623280 RepID=A0A1T4ZYZ4_9SPHI|nr:MULTISPECIES: sugar kinase [Parapedobacter]MBK1438808.1 sugar kinase [Parapedobacter sp. ISTM3]SKB27948.1 2-dehydro-3-deoxygluconokinase [Parapedobacter luteus]
MIKHKILSFGELLLRLSSSGESFLGADGQVVVFPGGSEANVAASLGQLGIACSYLSRVPGNELALQALSTLKTLGVDVSPTLLEGDRMGLYFLLSANGLSKGEVVYDRNYSAFSELKPGTINWDAILEDFTWLHWSALTPALSAPLADVCLEALEVAHRKGLTVSVDLNYRNKLWNYGKQPIEVMPALLQYCDVVMGNIWAANKMVGSSVLETLTRDTPPEVYFEHAKESAGEVFGLLPRCKHIAYTFRFMDSATHNLLYGTYHTREADFISPVNETNGVIDRIGSGDAFMAGLIYALVNEKGGQDIIDAATAAGFKKLFVKGDFGNGAI